MNNLYGWSMNEYLPYGEFERLENVDKLHVDKLHVNVK